MWPALAVVPLLALSRLVGDPLPLPELPKGVEEAPWEEMVVAECRERLELAGVEKVRFIKRKRVKRLRARRQRNPELPEVPDHYCYVPQALQYVRGPGKINYSGYMMMNCQMALAMARFERIVQDEARRVFGPKARVSWIKSYGTYNCRRLRKYPWIQSQHSFGNAVDIGAFHVTGYGRVNVKRHWTPKYPSQERASDFLRGLAARLVTEQIFSNVLTPAYDKGHSNHFHLDLEPGALWAGPGDLLPR